MTQAIVTINVVGVERPYAHPSDIAAATEGHSIDVLVAYLDETAHLRGRALVVTLTAVREFVFDRIVACVRSKSR
jgi:hypothetical protein